MNYIVRIKNVKVDRLNTLINYLNDTKHKNHTKKNTQIFEMSNREDFLTSTIEKQWKNAESYIKNKKGGRKLNVVGKSLTFNIPKGFEFDMDIGLQINNDIITKIKELYKSINYDLEDNELYGVLHHQDNNHFHYFIPYLDKEGKTLRDIKPKKFLNELKLLWNEIMINRYGISLNDYQPLSEEEQHKDKNRRYLEELKEYYLTMYVFENTDKYIKNQVVKIDRLLKMSDTALGGSDGDIDLLEENFKKVLNNQKNRNSPKMKR